LPRRQDLPGALARLERLLQSEQQNDNVRRSLEGQIEILRQRIAHRVEAERQLAFIDAELSRIEQQVELLREQATLSTDPGALSGRIDEIAATLGGTSQWMRDQVKVLGAMDDLLIEVPPPTSRARAKETE
jgi:chromosome segregation ATPase